MNAILAALSAGLPPLITLVGLALLLVVAGTEIYKLMTPFDELALIKEKNISASISYVGGIIGIGLPVIVVLATNHSASDVVVWGSVAVALQIIAYRLFAMIVQFKAYRTFNIFLPKLREQIEADNTAVALVLLAFQIVSGGINAGAMAL